MKQELQDKALEIITQIQGAIQSSANWTLEQLPDIAYQFILFNRAYYSFVMLVLLIFICSAVYLFYLYWKKEEYDPMPILFGMIVVPAFLFFVNLSPFLMVWFAPKVFLLTELVNLFK